MKRGRGGDRLPWIGDAGVVGTILRVAKKVGTSTGGIETSAAYKKKRARRRAAEEASWAAKSGPVIVRFAGHEIYVKSKEEREADDAARASKRSTPRSTSRSSVDPAPAP